ncbi:MAG: signal peptidase II [Lachnospiraceae bacterium]|nr:signal peptidase II [Lachnospiraceae bacterium]
MVWILLVGLLAGIDLCIKAEIEARDSSEFPKPLEQTKGKIILHKSHNAGFPFEILKSRPDLVEELPRAVFCGLSGVFGFLLPQKGHRIEKLSMALTLGGALSNLYDRAKRKYVVDYFSIDVKGIKKVIFNLGDFFIFAGAALTVIAMLVNELGQRGKKKKQNTRR